MQMRVVALLVAATLCSACTCKGVPKEFFLLSPEKQRVEFEKYDFDTQYDIFICSQQKVEPPELELATLFASKGTAIIRPLEMKLNETRDDRTIRDIVFVFSEMSRQGTYDVASDKSLLNELQRKTSAIRDPTVRFITEESLHGIQTKSGNDKVGSS